MKAALMRLGNEDFQVGDKVFYLIGENIKNGVLSNIEQKLDSVYEADNRTLSSYKSDRKIEVISTITIFHGMGGVDESKKDIFIIGNEDDNWMMTKNLRKLGNHIKRNVKEYSDRMLKSLEKQHKEYIEYSDRGNSGWEESGNILKEDEI